MWYTYINEREVMIMFTNYLACPQCGSTAQPRFIGEEINNNVTIIRKFVCGCGCKFKAVYKIKEIYTTIERSDNDD